jgi:hypothetical protein
MCFEHIYALLTEKLLVLYSFVFSPLVQTRIQFIHWHESLHCCSRCSLHYAPCSLFLFLFLSFSLNLFSSSIDCFYMYQICSFSYLFLDHVYEGSESCQCAARSGWEAAESRPSTHPEHDGMRRHMTPSLTHEIALFFYNIRPLFTPLTSCINFSNIYVFLL